MEKKDIINRIVDAEWRMFRTVNGEARVSCQEDRITFDGMRRAQFSLWSGETLESYLDDLTEAEQTGRNLLREKYLHMTLISNPGTDIPRDALPPANAETDVLVDAVWTLLLPRTIALREAYPYISARGRPLRTRDEPNGYPSVETYQKGELMTLSPRTLRLLLEHLRRMESQGDDYVRAVQEASVRALGYASLDAAEAAVASGQI